MRIQAREGYNAWNALADVSWDSCDGTVGRFRPEGSESRVPSTALSAGEPQSPTRGEGTPLRRGVFEGDRLPDPAAGDWGLGRGVASLEGANTRGVALLPVWPSPCVAAGGALALP